MPIHFNILVHTLSTLQFRYGCFSRIFDSHRKNLDIGFLQIQKRLAKSPLVIAIHMPIAQIRVIL